MWESVRSSPTLLMICGALCWSPFPLLLTLSQPHATWWLFVGVWATTHGATMTAMREPTRTTDDRRWVPVVCRDVAGTRLGDWLVLFVGSSRYLWFALAIAISDPIIASVVYQLWPAWLAALMLTPTARRRLLNDVRPDRSAVRRTFTCVATGCVGVSLVVLAVDDGSAAALSVVVVAGLGLALLSGAIDAATVLTYLMAGAESARRVGAVSPQHSVVVANGVHAVTRFAFGIAMIAAAVVATLNGAEMRLTFTGMLYASLAAVCTAVGVVLFTASNQRARHRHGHAAARVNVFYGVQPVVATLLLAWLTDTHIRHWHALAVGVLLIVAAGAWTRQSPNVPASVDVVVDARRGPDAEPRTS